MPRSARLVAVLASIAVLAGCAVPVSFVSRHRPLAPAWSVEVETLGWPRRAGDIVLSFVVTGDGGEALTAWNATSGEELWTTPTVPGGDDPGAFHYVATHQDDADVWHVAYLRADPAGSGVQLTVADARTGEVQSATVIPDGGIRPRVCDGLFCTGVETDNRTYDWSAVNAEGALVPWTAGADAPFVTPGSAAIGEYLFVPAGTGPLGLHYARDGRVWWSRPYTEVFGADTASGYGYDWWDDADETAIVGWTRRLPGLDLSGPGTFEADLASAQVTVGLDRDTGATLWTAAGLRGCRVAVWAPDASGSVTLCDVVAGSLSLTWTGDEDSVPVEEAEVVENLVSVERSTGVERWSVPLGILPEGTATLESSAREAVVLSDSGVVAIDVASGDVVSIDPTATVLCFVESESGGDWRRALCDETGAPVDAPMTREALRIAGWRNGVAVLNRQDGLSAYVLGDAWKLGAG